MESLGTAQVNTLMTTLSGYASLYGLKLLGALAIFFIGKWAVKVAVRLVGKMMERGNVDPTLRTFGANILTALGLAFVILAALSQVGVQTASLIAVLGAAGLAVGLALQGSLSNLAAGVMIILFRPFHVGDYIEAAGVGGSVKDLNIFTTTLLTPDNKTIIVPNNNVTSGNITNYSTQETRRVDLVFGVGYEADLKKAKELLTRLVNEDPRVLKEPEPVIAAMELADNSVNFWVRPWVKTSDFWPFQFDITEKVKVALDAEGISIPFPSAMYICMRMIRWRSYSAHRKKLHNLMLKMRALIALCPLCILICVCMPAKAGMQTIQVAKEKKIDTAEKNLEPDVQTQGRKKGVVRSVTPVSECFTQIGREEMLQIMREFRFPYQECQRRLEKRQAEQEKEQLEKMDKQQDMDTGEKQQ